MEKDRYFQFSCMKLVLKELGLSCPVAMKKHKDEIRNITHDVVWRKHSNVEFMWNAVALALWGALEAKIAIYVHQTNGNGPSDRLTT